MGMGTPFTVKGAKLAGEFAGAAECAALRPNYFPAQN
jgi:hypothetical protein